MSRHIFFATALSLSLATAGPLAQGGVPASGPEQPLNLPSGERWLGSVRIPVAVLADGKPLPAGRYRVRLTGRTAEKDVVGQLETLERWVEFVQQNQVRGRALVPVVPSSAVKEVADVRPPATGTFRVQRLKGNDYLRLWYNLKGDQVLIHLPVHTHTALPTGKG